MSCADMVLFRFDLFPLYSTPTIMATGEGMDLKTYEEKKLIVSDRLQKRDDDRKTEAQKRHEERDNLSTEQENTEFIRENIAKDKLEIESELLQCDSLPRNKLIDKFDSISVLHQKLQKFVSESSMYLPSYYIRVTQETLSKLQADIQEKRDALLPKKKFAFKSKKKETGTEKLAKPKEDHKDAPQVSLAECRFTNLSDQNLEKVADEINAKDVSLTDLKSCTVKLYGAPSAIQIKKLTNCRVFTGPVSGSVFISECYNCVFLVPCQQLRVHTTTSSQFYIHVTSRAIIEDSSAVEFGCYNWVYPELEEHYKLSGLDKSRNSWSDIDDFNWLAADKHSPNWSIITEEKQVKSWEE